MAFGSVKNEESCGKQNLLPYFGLCGKLGCGGF